MLDFGSSKHRAFSFQRELPPCALAPTSAFGGTMLSELRELLRRPKISPLWGGWKGTTSTSPFDHNRLKKTCPYFASEQDEDLPKPRGGGKAISEKLSVRGGDNSEETRLRRGSVETIRQARC